MRALCDMRHNALHASAPLATAYVPRLFFNPHDFRVRPRPLVPAEHAATGQDKRLPFPIGQRANRRALLGLGPARAPGGRALGTVSSTRPLGSTSPGSFRCSTFRGGVTLGGSVFATKNPWHPRRADQMVAESSHLAPTPAGRGATPLRARGMDVARVDHRAPVPHRARLQETSRVPGLQ